jgi:hypothetical protein
MKILVAFLAIAVAAVLVVSATMGAETLVPGGESTKKKPRGGLAMSGKARLLPTSSALPSLKGTGFKAGENVVVRVLGGTTKTTRRVRADGSGSFVVRLAAGFDRCNGMTVTAVGDKGSRTSFQFAELLCATSGARP